MMSSRKPVTGVMPAAAIHALGEIKDAVRELRRSAPDSVLIRLAEQKIDRLECDRGPHGDGSNTSARGQAARDA